MPKKEMPQEFMTFWYGAKSTTEKQSISNPMNPNEQEKEWIQFLASIKESIEKRFHF